LYPSLYRCRRTTPHRKSAICGENLQAVAPISYLETDILYCDDNLERLSQFPSECIDLIYLDPPFFSNRHYEVIWGDEAEIRSFEDRWEGGIQVYIAWMRERMFEIHRVLKPTGSVYLHCDWHASHYLKVMMDDLFGADRFQNEIAWCYNVGGKSSKRWARKHDTLLFYSKGKTWYFDGKAVGILRETGTKSFGGKIGTDESGRRYQDKLAKSGKYYRYYLDDPKIPEDWWVINSIQSQSAERLGYPTQKPEALLERIIGASSKRDDIVLDPFCGCGTTVAVAERLHRKWIGIDISPTAVNLMRARVEKLRTTDIKVVGMPVAEDELRAIGPYAFQNWVIQRINGTHAPRKSGDMGIDGYSFMEHHPVQVKQSDRVGRNVVDNFETALRRSGRNKGFIIAFSFTRGAKEEAARARREDDLDIDLLPVSELLADRSELARPHEEMLRDLMPAARPADSRPSASELVRSIAGRRS
jgi:DNA modification methylase